MARVPLTLMLAEPFVVPSTKVNVGRGTSVSLPCVAVNSRSSVEEAAASTSVKVIPLAWGLGKFKGEFWLTLAAAGADGRQRIDGDGDLRRPRQPVSGIDDANRQRNRAGET